MRAGLGRHQEGEEGHGEEGRHTGRERAWLRGRESQPRRVLAKVKWLVVPEFQYRRGGSGEVWLEWNDPDWETR